MDKRYQVFISSTYTDLKDARQEVSQALLRAHCFPAGMELFPATDVEQFEYIKSVIRDSDYYVIISAGRYGSIHPDVGLSYTELEYDYAMEIGVPIIRLLHTDPFKKLTGEHIESNDVGREKLRVFREKMRKSRLVRHWATKEQLGTEIVLALLDMQKSHPRDGWVPGSQSFDAETYKELERLRTENRELSQQLFAHNTFDLTEFSNALTGTVECTVDERINSRPMPELIKTSKVRLPKSDFIEIFLYALLGRPLVRSVAALVGLQYLQRENLPRRPINVTDNQRFFSASFDNDNIVAALDHCVHQGYVQTRTNMDGDYVAELTELGERSVRGHRAAKFVLDHDD